MSREQVIALVLLGVLILAAVAILTIKVLLAPGGFGLDELPG